MQITVFGASGKVGQVVVKRALAQGHSVRAFVHNHNPFAVDATLQVITGDVYDTETISKALQGSQAVISTLGSWGTIDKNTLTTGMQTIIPALQQQGITRIVTLTGAGAAWRDDKPSLLAKLNRLMPVIVAPKILHDGETHLQLLVDSDLVWTCVRAPVIHSKSGSSDSYLLNLTMPSPLASVSVTAVAHALVDLVEQPAFLKQAPLIHQA